MSARRLSRRSILRAARYALLIALAIAFLMPLLVALNASLKPPSEISASMSLPSQLYLDNYVEGWERIGRGVLNSFMITVPAVVLSVFVGCLAAYPLSQLKIPGGRAVYMILLAGMLVPYQAVQIPLFLIMRNLGLYNTIPGMWLVHTAYAIPFCTFFMRNFFITVPRSMFEAAQLDGCGPAGYFFKILLPASISGIAALSIVQSRSIWNDLFFGLTITNNVRTNPAPVALYSMIGGMDVDEGPVMAATIISILPMMIAFLLFQKAFTRGLLGGSSK
ncbi:carbohydrate ABC transporter permease [Microvirga lotononidis]|uniref:sn-glycerol-3-phosphate transport system permease protein UgpE n=1 Tax=Microvirga lotononidis TaxID=864069 RepID=I4Z262_9HYPH|nr:carbohydrate ABC transporter permease [Microvirga lotononidis]EIM30304.1 ABC-type sugar transport system, permease component [Microvirga lotononidis]WQO31149.1 carbohydrate ABC transporter permease [Microvirga lotononidis]